MDNDTTKAIRAIASQMVRQFLMPFIVGGGVLLAIIFIIVIVLSINYSGWWLIILLPLVPLSIIFMLIIAGLWFINIKIVPSMSKAQRKAVKTFTERIGAYSDIIGTPRFIIAFRVIRDVIRKHPRKYLGELVDSSSELNRDFDAVRRSFKS